MLQFDYLPEGAQFRLMRIAVGLTLYEVGKRAGVSPPRLSEFERGRSSLAPDAVDRVRAVLSDSMTQSEREAAGAAS